MMAGMNRSEAAKVFEVMLERDGEEPISNARQNKANRDNVIRNWSLGPENATVEPNANGPYWRKMAGLWDVSEPEARRQMCANCEYYNNTPAMMEEMEAIPLDKYDMDGGGRGYCERFDFICHSLRTCQAWEEKAYEEED